MWYDMIKKKILVNIHESILIINIILRSSLKLIFARSRAGYLLERTKGNKKRNCTTNSKLLRSIYACNV